MTRLAMFFEPAGRHATRRRRGPRVSDPPESYHERPVRGLKTVETLRTVNWLIHASRDVASSRLQGYLVHEGLQRRGVTSNLVMSPPVVMRDVPWPFEEHPRLCRLLAGQIVVIQKLTGPRVDHLVTRLRDVGATTIYVQCDYFPDHTTPQLCDAIVCPSAFLAEFYASRGVAKVVRIDDPAENWCRRETIAQEHSSNSRLKLCWIGSRQNWLTLEPLRAVLSEREFEDVRLITVSDHPDADRPWRRSDVNRVIAGCDVGVVPVGNDSRARAKSSNRVVLFMAAGKPVVAGSIPAYEELIRDDENGFLCSAMEDWRRALRALRDPERRHRVALKGYDSVSPRFRVETVVGCWADLLTSLSVADRERTPADREPTGHIAAVRDRAAIRVQARLAYASALVESNKAGRALQQLLKAAPHAMLAPRFGGSWLRSSVEAARTLVKGEVRSRWTAFAALSSVRNACPEE